MPMDMTRSQVAGFVSHLMKPVSIEELDQALTLACQRAGRA